MTKLSVNRSPFTLETLAFEPIRLRLAGWLFPQPAVTISEAYLRFSSAYPLWAKLYFDLEFIEQQVVPLIELYQRYDQSPTPMDVALLWDEQYGTGAHDERKRLVEKLALESAQFLATLV